MPLPGVVCTPFFSDLNHSLPIRSNIQARSHLAPRPCVWVHARTVAESPRQDSEGAVTAEGDVGDTERYARSASADAEASASSDEISKGNFAEGGSEEPSAAAVGSSDAESASSSSSVTVAAAGGGQRLVTSQEQRQGGDHEGDSSAATAWGSPRPASGGVDGQLGRQLQGLLGDQQLPQEVRSRAAAAVLAAAGMDGGAGPADGDDIADFVVPASAMSRVTRRG